MKENEFLDGVSNIDPDVVERFVSMDNKLQKDMASIGNNRSLLLTDCKRSHRCADAAGG